MYTAQLNSFGYCIVDSSEEDPIEDEPEAVVYREPTTYDNLLASLGSSNKMVADMNKRRYFYKVACFWKFQVLVG